APSRAEAGQAGKERTPLRIAVAAMISPEETLNVYQELMDYIAAKLGRPVEMKQRRTYQEVNDMLGTGKLDAAILCSGTYVHAKRQYGVELLAVPVINGSPTYRSYIIVPQSSTAASLEELHRKRFAFTDPLSTSGYLYPVYYLVSRGRQPATFFAKTLFTYSHDNSIEAVAESVVDGAAVDSLIYDYLQVTKPALVAQTRIVHRSPSFGAQPVGVPKNLDPATRRALRDLFLGLDQDPAGQGILRKLGVDRFIPGNDRLYDSIRKMLRVMERARIR
ncbi:MAG: phosphate/phosphite/phosphonate ABC transporter substrate-binding protein, partial [candidate division NC10 bacterium]|nr:phosphate/phosphite/phosphonate ABC transporter substrate-binding protein [candidate division NC10 bacterium]